MNVHEVDYMTYCDLCEHSSVKETEEPCNSCLYNPSNEDSRRPVYFQKKETIRRK